MGCSQSSPDSTGYTLADAPVFSSDVTGSLILPVVDEATETEILQSAVLGDFQFRDIVGRGGKSVGVQVAYSTKTSKYYAVKIIDERQAELEGWEVQPQDELAALRAATAAGCNFVVPLQAAFELDGKMYLVMSFMSGGELTNRVHGRRMSRDEVMFYSAEVALALKSLHALGFIYRDLKPENILLNEDGHCFLCDLGFAIRQPRVYRKLGTPQYLAPEILSENLATEGYTSAVDWWAFGCLLFELFTGQAAWGAPDASPEEVFACILKYDLAPLPPSVPADARDLIKKLLDPDPVTRLNRAEAVQAHPFYARLDWVKVRRQRYQAPWIPPPMRFGGDVTNFDIQLRLEGKTIVPRGAKSRIVFEKPVPAFPDKRRLSASRAGGRNSDAAAADAASTTAAPEPARVSEPAEAVAPTLAPPAPHHRSGYLRPQLLPAISEGGASVLDDSDDVSSRSVLPKEVVAYQASVVSECEPQSVRAPAASEVDQSGASTLAPAMAAKTAPEGADASASNALAQSQVEP